MAGQWGGGPQHTPSAAHLSAGCPPPQIFDREKDGTPANEGPDPLHLSAVLRPPASHPHSRFQSLPGWTGQAFPVGGGRGSSRNSAPGDSRMSGVPSFPPPVSHLYFRYCSGNKGEEGLPSKDKAAPRTIWPGEPQPALATRPSRRVPDTSEGFHSFPVS